MTPATLSDRKAQLLLRIRWLAWGAIAALLAGHLSVTVALPAQFEILPLEQSAAHVGETCGCKVELTVQPVGVQGPMAETAGGHDG